MLTFNLKKEWFEKIKNGEKNHEYRELKPYWTKRFSHLPDVFFDVKANEFIKLKKHNLDIECCFKLGYPKPSESSKILYGMVKTIKIVCGKKTDLKINNFVYDIEFELIKEDKCL